MVKALAVTGVLSVLVGCSSVGRCDEYMLLSMSNALGSHTVDICTDGLVHCRLRYRFPKARERGSIERQYRVACDVTRARTLRDNLAALSHVRNPELMPVGTGADVVKVYARGQVIAEFSIGRANREPTPFWQGVIEEFGSIVHLNLLRSIFYREVAEAYTNHGNLLQASANYGFSLDRALKAHHRLLDELEAEPFADDSELLLVEPSGLHRSQRYEEAIDASRAAWVEMLSGDVRIFASGEVLAVVIRGPLYEHLRWLHEDCVGGALYGPFEGVERDCRSLLVRYEQMARAFPASFDYQLCRMWCRYNLGAILDGNGKGTEARDVYGIAREELGRLEPDLNDAIGSADLAWFRAKCPHSDFRDPTRAVALAERAVELAPGDIHCWLSLGVARYTMAEWAGAAVAFDRADVGCTEDGGTYAAFYAAMAYARKGEQQRARQRYDKALAVLEGRGPGCRDERYWNQARDEAAAVLGLSVSRAADVHVLYPPEEWRGRPIVGGWEHHP
jgi:tetratricopeptide (TPR) repeat protein